jgi:hypothetical protein
MSGEDAPRPCLENLIVPEIKTNKLRELLTTSCVRIVAVLLVHRLLCRSNHDHGTQRVGILVSHEQMSKDLMSLLVRYMHLLFCTKSLIASSKFKLSAEWRHTPTQTTAGVRVLRLPDISKLKARPSKLKSTKTQPLAVFFFTSIEKPTY